MPVTADIGTHAGEVAAGERSPDALLLTAGQVLGRNAAGVNPITPPGYPTVDLGRAYTPSATTEGSLLNAGVATSGLFAAGIAVGDMWEIDLSGTFLSSVGSLTSRVRVYFGAFAIGDATSAVLTASGTTREWAWTLRAIVETIGAAGTGTLRVSGRRWGIDTVQAVGTGYRAVAASTEQRDIAESTGTSVSPALITNAASDFNVTATHSTNAGTITTACTEAVVKYFPKNR